MDGHQERTSEFCREFLRRIEPALEFWGDLLGRWHDAGKYHPDFQKKLAGERVQIDHAVVGAALAIRQAGRAGQAAAFAIAGHHTGLANAKSNSPEDFPFVARIPLARRLRHNEHSLREVLPLLPESLRELGMPKVPGWITEAASPEAVKRCFSFFTRMLFSVLVDADRLATAEFYAETEGRQPEREHLNYDSLATLRDRLDAHIDRLAADANARQPSRVNTLRAEVLAACRAAAELPPGFFSLTVPTGGGKTLSAMSGALRHATCHGLDRVIVIIPFTSIIEQNAQRYREAFGTPAAPDNRNVLEHHSGIDEQKADEINRETALRRRLAAENWDAPIVVSTAVQFFESLFSDHPSQCRKLHRIAKSVVILDEVQTLPPGLLLPILDALTELTNHYGSTVVLSTATPPALAQRDGFPQGLAGVRPIIPDPVKLAASPAARRVRVDWRVDRTTTYDELAKELVRQDRVLAIVHRRQDARTLAEKLPTKGRFHLSALMCPAHRLKTIAGINQALKTGATCRIVSTQLIEAGVDIDLPVVYRALAGLDSLAQSAGRCDREGKLTEAAGRPAGEFIVFLAETSPPPGTLRKALESTQTLLAQRGSSILTDLDPFNPDHCELFFRELYGKQELDARYVQRERAAWNFANVAAAFQMIDNGWSRPIVVPWGEGADRIAAFRSQVCRETVRALQPFLVQVSRQHLEYVLDQGMVEPWGETNLHLPTSLFGRSYTEEFGLVINPDVPIDPELLMI